MGCRSSKTWAPACRCIRTEPAAALVYPLLSLLLAATMGFLQDAKGTGGPRLQVQLGPVGRWRGVMVGVGAAPLMPVA